jgi:hypothetical protein
MREIPDALGYRDIQCRRPNSPIMQEVLIDKCESQKLLFALDRGKLDSEGFI